MVYLNFRRLDDGKIISVHQVANLGNSAVNTVFKRQNTIAAHSAVHSIEHALEVFKKHNRRIEKQLFASLLRIRSLGSLARHNRGIGELFVGIRKRRLYIIDNF